MVALTEDGVVCRMGSSVHSAQAHCGEASVVPSIPGGSGTVQGWQGYL